MKWCRFQVGDKVSYGIEDEGRVLEVSGTPFETYTVTATTYPLSAVKLLVPVIPPTFYAGGLNYPEHVQWWAQGTLAPHPASPPSPVSATAPTMPSSRMKSTSSNPKTRRTSFRWRGNWWP